MSKPNIKTCCGARWDGNRLMRCPTCGSELAASACSLCGGLTMIPSDDPDGDIMNTPCPKCNEWSPDFKENSQADQP